MHPELEHLARADRCDREIRDTDRALAEADEALALARDRVAEAEKTLAALAEERAAQKAQERHFERELHLYQERRASALRALEGGGGDPEAAARQLQQCEQILDRTETELLHLLEEADTLVARCGQAETALEQARDELKRLEGEHPVRVAELRARREEAVRAREEELDAVDPQVRTRYETLRERKGTAVARVEGNACSACRHTVQPQHLADLRRGLMEPCRSCGRWLVPPER